MFARENVYCLDLRVFNISTPLHFFAQHTTPPQIPAWPLNILKSYRVTYPTTAEHCAGINPTYLLLRVRVFLRSVPENI